MKINNSKINGYKRGNFQTSIFESIQRELFNVQVNGGFLDNTRPLTIGTHAHRVVMSVHAY